jgi:hypothetical protein
MSFLCWVLWVFRVSTGCGAGWPDLQRKREEIVEKRRGRGGGAMMLFAGARCPCLGLARPTRPAPFSRPTPVEERKLWFAGAPILQTHAGGRERRSWVAGALPDSDEKIKRTRKWKQTYWGSELDQSWPVRMICRGG